MGNLDISEPNDTDLEQIDSLFEFFYLFIWVLPVLL